MQSLYRPYTFTLIINKHKQIRVSEILFPMGEFMRFWMGQGLKLRFQGLDYMEIKLSEYNLPLNLIIEYISSRKSMHYTTKNHIKYH